MRNIALLTLLLALWTGTVGAQTPDTTIYEVADRLPLPLLASCQPSQHPGWTEDSIRRCAEAQLLSVVTRNIRYPEEARENNLEGTVVTSFVVEPDGRLSNIKILRDIGGGCGAEAARVLQALDEAGLRWLPAQREGKPVRMRQALPLRFRLKEALPYYVGPEGDSIYVVVDSLPNFEGGADGLTTYVLNELGYPAEYQDSCKAGIIEIAIIIQPDGRVKVDNLLDFSNLGLDFQWESIRLVNQMTGLWTPARYQDRPVATTVPLRTLFKSDQPGCKTANERFDQAMLLANEAAQMTGAEDQEKALEKWNQALALQPGNTELLYYRGSALLAVDRREEACADFSRVKEILKTTWFEPLRKLVCGW